MHDVGELEVVELEVGSCREDGCRRRALTVRTGNERKKNGRPDEQGGRTEVRFRPAKGHRAMVTVAPAAM